MEPFSQQLYQRAVKVIPGGVTRPFRFFEPYPFYAKKAYASKLVDYEGNVYTDFWQAHGALVLGHMHAATINATKEQLELGFHLGVCNEWEVKLAEQVTKLIPSVKMITFTNSGTEANIHALKLARAYTKRDKIGKFERHFHGILESLYVGVGGRRDEPDSAGHDALSTRNTVVLPLHDADTACKAIRKEQMACVILELVTSGSCIPEKKEFIKELREVCDETGTLLIFDEVITGFRLARGGCQEVYGVTPDLTTLGKAIGGGEFAAGAVGGRADVMELMNCQKYPKRTEHVVAGGTYVGNPLMTRAGYEAMKVFEEGSVYPHISKLGQRLTRGLQEAVDDTDANACVTGLGSIVKLHFLKCGTEYKGVKSLLTDFDPEAEGRYFHFLVSNEIFAMLPGQVHFYVCLPHTEQEIDATISATEDFLRSMPK